MKNIYYISDVTKILSFCFKFTEKIMFLFSEMESGIKSDTIWLIPTRLEEEEYSQSRPYSRFNITRKSLDLNRSFISKKNLCSSDHIFCRKISTFVQNQGHSLVHNNITVTKPYKSHDQTIRFPCKCDQCHWLCVPWLAPLLVPRFNLRSVCLIIEISFTAQLCSNFHIRWPRLC